MRCLVTGGAGFLGRWVVGQLLAGGHEVLVVDDLSSGRAENLDDWAERGGYLGLVRGDVRHADLLERVFSGREWDAVVHIAVRSRVRSGIDDPVDVVENDTEGTLRVLERCRAQYFALGGLDPRRGHFDFERDRPRLTDLRPRFVSVSSCMVYDTAGEVAISETHPYRPASPYAAAKIAADMLTLSYFHCYGLPTTVLRPFNTYGPFQESRSEGGVVAAFLARDLAGSSLQVRGNGEQTRDLMYIEDCARFVCLATTSERAVGEVLNAGTGQEVSILELARLCCSVPERIEFVPHDRPQAEMMRLRCDPSRAQRLLGWQPEIGLVEGLARTRAWLLDRAGQR